MSFVNLYTLAEKSIMYRYFQAFYCLHLLHRVQYKGKMQKKYISVIRRPVIDSFSATYPYIHPPL